MSRLIILLPTKNEEKGLGEVITGVPIQEISDLGYSTKIIVVDGNSSDSTCDIAISNGAELIKQNGSTGKGNGVRQALDEIFQKEHQDDDLLVMLDADATYDPKDIPAFVEELTDYEVNSALTPTQTRSPTRRFEQ